MRFLRHKNLIRAFLLGLAASAAGCSSLNPMNWWTSDTEPKIADLPEIKPSLTVRNLWQVNVGNGGNSLFTPAVASGSAFAAGTDGTVAKIEIASGKPLWRVNIGEKLSSGVGSDGNIVAVGTAEGDVIALEADSGMRRWRVRVSSEVLAPPAVAGDLVLIRSADSRIFALDVKDGRRRWVYQRSAPSLAVRSHAGLVAANGLAYAGFSGGKLVAIALSNGGVRWEATVALPKGTNELDRVTDVIGLPWVFEREVCAVAYQGRVACFESGNGEAIWGREMSSTSGLGGDLANIYVSDDKGAVHALSRSSGTSVWRQDRLYRRLLTSPVSIGKQIAVGDVQGFVHLIGIENGAFEGRSATDGSPISAPLVSIGNTLLAQTRNGSLIALSIQ